MLENLLGPETFVKPDEVPDFGVPSMLFQEISMLLPNGWHPEKAKAGVDVPGFDNAGSEDFLEPSPFSLKRQGLLSNR